MAWIPLRAHSQFSILEALAPINAIVSRAAKEGMEAVALTDSGNLHGAVEFVQACKKKGVRPIVGCDLYMAPEARTLKKRMPGKANSSRVVLLAMDREGYKNLCKLSSAGYLEGFYHVPRIDFPLLEEHSQGLICLLGGTASPVGLALEEGGEEAARAVVERYHQLFGDRLYLALERHEMEEAALRKEGMYAETWLLQKYQSYIERQKRLNRFLVSCALPLVATNNSHYMERGDWFAHEILLNVQSREPCEVWEESGTEKRKVQNPRRKVFPSHEHHFRGVQEMQELFADIPEALANTVEVAKRCTFQMDFSARYYPKYTPPKIELSKEEFLRKLCEEGISERYTEERLRVVQERIPDRDPMEVVRERLEYEMDIIVSKEMCDYFLIVWDFIHWAKGQKIPVGPGRGSGVGSIILYLIGVTDIEPLRFSLFFERFINPERLSYPDIDVDICMDRRAEVIQYTLNKYGKENVAQIVTFNRMKARLTIKDVGRVLSVPLSKVNAICKLVPEDLGITLDEALEKEPELTQLASQDEEVARILDIGRRLEGSVRNVGIHAAGLIICGEPLTDHIPVCLSKDAEMPVTQYSMKPVEKVGMLKIDFLGLKALTSIQMTVDAVKVRRGIPVDWVDLPLDNEETFALLNQGKTMTVFQLESSGMQDLARQLYLDRFQEIIAVGALYRPGPMDMIPSFVARKHKREPIEYDHPWMEEILSETYGIMVYQEQVMQIAQKLAQYSLGEGDVLRRAMGKKERQAMAAERQKFLSGARTSGIDSEVAIAIFDKMEKFAAYGFNKSHATAYGYLSYVTAYLKANFAPEWFAALMTCDFGDVAKVAKYIRESRSMGIPMLPPDINEAGATFVATDQGIRFAMSGIRGIGQGMVEAIVEERNQRGPFTSLHDFLSRNEEKRVGKKMVETLIEAGAFDSMGWTRDELLATLEPTWNEVEKKRRDDQAGFMDLFAAIEEQAPRIQERPKVSAPRSRTEVLLKEKELLGLFLSGHPLQEKSPLLERLSCHPLSKIEELPDGTLFRVAFLVEAVRTRLSARNNTKFAILQIGEGEVSYELPIWSDLYEQSKELLEENRLLFAVVQVEEREQSRRLQCHWLTDLVELTEADISLCDRAYDAAKVKVQNRKKYAQRKKEEPPRVSTAKAAPLCIEVDANRVRLSKLLQLATLLKKADRGPHSVEVRFTLEGETLGHIHCSQDLAVADTESIQREWAELMGNRDHPLTSPESRL